MNRFGVRPRSRCLLLLLALVSSGTALGVDPVDIAWTLDYGDASTWRSAILELVRRDQGIPSRAVASVLRRHSVLSDDERGELLGALRPAARAGDPRVLGFLREYALDGPEALSSAAVAGLLKVNNPAVVPILTDLVSFHPGTRKRLASRILSLYRSRLETVMERRALNPHDAAALARSGHSEPDFWPAYRRLTSDPDGSIRHLMAEHLRWFGDQRAETLLWKLVGDDDADVARTALWSLGWRRNGKACDQLIETYWDATPVGQDVDRRRSDLADTGEVCAPTHLKEMVLRVRVASSTRVSEAEALLSRITGSPMWPLLDDRAFRAQIETWSSDGDSLVGRQAGLLLAAADAARRKQLLAERPFWLGPVVLCLLAVASLMLGFVLFLWGFRLVQLLRLLHHLAPSTIQSLAVGTGLVHGRIEAADTPSLTHPQTGEDCLYYAGADQDCSQHRFYLVDGTGRLLIDPRGAVLLSEDGLLIEGTSVRVLGKVSRAKTGGAAGTMIMAKDSPRRTLIGRCGHFLVQGVLGLWDRSGTGRALFSDPLRCFWIWDEIDERPLHGRLELYRMLLVFLLAGVWITVFAVAALAVFDREFSEVLNLWLNH